MRLALVAGLLAGLGWVLLPDRWVCRLVGHRSIDLLLARIAFEAIHVSPRVSVHCSRCGDLLWQSPDPEREVIERMWRATP